METILELSHISKNFSGVKALNSVSLQLKRGTVHALMGENGAGKSTLMKIVAGIYTPDEGEIRLSGKPIEVTSPAKALEYGIAMIHQELSPVPEMTVAENIFLGREPTRYGFVDFKEMFKRTERLFGSIGIAINPRSRMKDLKVSDIQLVEIAKALSFDSEVIIMDEPTSAITDREVDQLFAVIADLKSKGKGIIYISHKMNEIFQISDEITVLRDGQYINTKAAVETNTKEIISMMVGRELADVFPKTIANPKEVILEVNNLSKKGQFYNISFQVRRGEIVGVAGLMGSGRTEVMEAVFGITKPDAGEIWIEGNKVNLSSPMQAISLGLAFVTEDRKKQGLNLLASVKDNITISSLDDIMTSGLLNLARERQLADHYIEKLRIKTRSRDQKVQNLSGGNQQKVVLAKWLMTKPKILILDEPTRGIDVGAKFEIYKLINQLASDGYAVIVISSELPEIIGLSHRILVFHERTLAGELDSKEANQESIMELATGHKNNRRETHVSHV
jgi:inositol transport system ATP-binding protein